MKRDAGTFIKTKEGIVNTFFFSSRRRHTRSLREWSSDVCSSDLNPAAASYGDWQLAQAYAATGDLQKSLEYGDKALAGSPHNLDILVSQAGVAQQAKNNVKLMEDRKSVVEGKNVNRGDGGSKGT